MESIIDLVSQTGVTGIFLSSSLSLTLCIHSPYPAIFIPPRFLHFSTVLSILLWLFYFRSSTSVAGYHRYFRLHQVFMSRESNQYGRPNHEYSVPLVIGFFTDCHMHDQNFSNHCAQLKQQLLALYNSSTKNFNTHYLRPQNNTLRRGNWFGDSYLTGQTSQG